MSMRPLIILPFLLLSAAQPVAGTQEPTGRIEGRVFGRHGSVVGFLPHAMVAMSSEGTHRTATTDSLGAYSVAGLHPGSWRVRVLHVGYEDIVADVRVPAGGRVELDMELRWRPVALPPLRILADPLGQPATPEGAAPAAALGEVALRALEASPGMVEAGLADVVRSLPGNDPANPTDVLYLRGSATDLKLVLLDGAPLYTPFHMAGLVESFDPLALGGASLFLGGAPARFDGGLSYILDLRSRSPRRDRLHGNAALDIMTGRLLLEGPLTPNTGFLLGTRTIHDLGTPVLGRSSSPYGYGDMLGRLEWESEGGQGAYLTGFFNQESVALDLLSPTAAAVAEGGGPGLSSVFGGPAPGEGARWGNRAVSGGFWGTVGETLIEVKAASSRYDAELPIGDSLPLFATSRSDRTRLTADFSTPWREGFLRFGASMDRQHSSFSAVALDSTQTVVQTQLEVDGLTGGGYVEGSQSVAPTLTVRGGIRLDRYSGDSGFRVAPRLALSWTLTEAAVLTLAAGRYHQFSNLSSGEVEETLDPGNTALTGGATNPRELAVGSANHLVVSLDQILTPGLRLGLEGFVKDFSGISGAGGQELNASGVDLRVAREGERAAGWLGYTLTWFWASGGIMASGASPFSGRHLLSAGLTTSLTNRTGLRLRASFGDGLPYTSVPLFGNRVASGDNEQLGEETRELEVAGDQLLNEAPELMVGPDEGFLRVEAEIYGRWTPTVWGRPMELRPYVRVLNALNRRDALFYHFDPWRSKGPEPLAELPFLPLVGLEWRF